GGVHVGDRPARAARDVAQLGLPAAGVDLYHHAVDVEREGPAALFPFGAEVDDRVDAMAEPGVAAGWQAPLAQRLEQPPLGFGAPGARRADGVADQAQPASRGDG